MNEAMSDRCNFREDPLARCPRCRWVGAATQANERKGHAQMLLRQGTRRSRAPARLLGVVAAALALVGGAVVIDVQPAHAIAGTVLEEFNGQALSRWRVDAPAGTSVQFGGYNNGVLRGRGDGMRVALATVAGRSPTSPQSAPAAHLYRTFEGGRPGACQLEMYLGLVSTAAASAEVVIYESGVPSGSVVASSGTQVWELNKFRRFVVSTGFRQSTTFTISIRIRVNLPHLELPARLGTSVVIDDVLLHCFEDPR
jgi:hypothetical protein